MAVKDLRTIDWAQLDDDALLRVRLCDLGLHLPDTVVGETLDRVHAQLERRGIAFRPHAWFSEEWFVPDGVAGIAVPFFVAHPRLRRLELRFMGEVEGGNRKWLTRILRHETGHALDNAYALRRRAQWRRTFGPVSRPYPTVYSPRPASKRHVLHLGHWYAQSHSTEDFAETFAVWLQPRAQWRRDYADWPALKKLEYVDRLMHEIAGSRPRRLDRSRVEPISGNRRTIGEHYRLKLSRYQPFDRRYDTKLSEIFVPRADRPKAVPASRFLREVEPQLRRLLVRRSRLHPYLVEHVIRTVARRARQLDLVLADPRRECKRRVVRLHESIVLDLLRRNRENYAL